jgi:hypothetical protein
MIDVLGDLDAPGTGTGTREVVFAGPNPVRLVQNGKPVREPPVAGVFQKPKGLCQCCGAEEIRILLRDRTGGITGTAKNAIRGIVEDVPLFLGLDPLLFLDRLVVDQEGLDGPVFLEEFGLIDHKVLDNRKMAKRFDADRCSLGIDHIPHECLAGQTILAVDAHCVRAAHTVGAALAEGKRAVPESFDLHEDIQEAVGGFGLNLIALKGSLLGLLRVEAFYFENDLHFFLLVQ